MLTLSARTRSTTEKVKDIRNNADIPAVVYGPKTSPVSIVVDYQEFRKVIKSAEMHTLFTLEVDGKKLTVYVKSFERDKVKDTYTHVDFYAVDEKSKVIVEVPVAFEGNSSAMRIGALLTVAMRKVKIECFPQNIPAKIVADISPLSNDGDVIRIAHLPAFEGVRYLMEGKVMVARAEFPRNIKVAENAAAAAAEKK